MFYSYTPIQYYPIMYLPATVYVPTPTIILEQTIIFEPTTYIYENDVSYNQQTGISQQIKQTAQNQFEDARPKKSIKELSDRIEQIDMQMNILRKSNPNRQRTNKSCNVTPQKNYNNQQPFDTQKETQKQISENIKSNIFSPKKQAQQQYDQFTPNQRYNMQIDGIPVQSIVQQDQESLQFTQVKNTSLGDYVINDVKTTIQKQIGDQRKEASRRTTTQHLQDNMYYEGELNDDGDKEGIGTLYDQHRSIVYRGIWKNNVFDVRGKLYYPKKYEQRLITIDNFDDQSDVHYNKISYTGEFINGEIYGLGQMLFGNQNTKRFIYHGQFQDGLFDGIGTVFEIFGKQNKKEGFWNKGLLINVLLNQ